MAYYVVWRQWCTLRGSTIVLKPLLVLPPVTGGNPRSACRMLLLLKEHLVGQKPNENQGHEVTGGQKGQWI